MAKVLIQKLDHFDDSLELPTYQTKLAAGADIRACLGIGESLLLKPGERKLVPTGLAFAIEDGFEVQVRPRSGMSFKTSLMVVNSPGTIDADYRGEIKIIMGNLGSEDQVIEHGDRVAQILLAPVYQADFQVVDSLDSTERGAGGFGSTGRN